MFFLPIKLNPQVLCLPLMKMFCLFWAADSAKVPFKWVQGKKRMFYLFIRSLIKLTSHHFSCISDPLVHRGRHFGWTVHALCNMNTLITNGLLRTGELADEPEESFTKEYALHYSLEVWRSPILTVHMLESGGSTESFNHS